MKTLLLSFVVSLALYPNVRAGEFLRLEEPRSRFAAERLSIAAIDPDGQIGSVNGVPVATKIPGLRLDAERGDMKSQVLLCKALDRHTTGSTNRVEAFKWALIASAHGDTEAKSLVRALGLFLSQAERAQGETLARSFVPTRPKSL